MVESVNTYLPFVTSTITFVFAALVLQRYLWRRHTHLLVWGVGLILYAVGGLMEGLYGALGWHPWIFRVWYLAGAVLVAAWLGQGTAFLLTRGRTRRLAHGLMVLLVLGSTYAAVKVFTATLDPTQMLGGELSGHAIVTPGVRVLTPFFNTYGVLLLVGGALYSAWIFWRKRILLNRVIGNVFIAVGAMAPALGGLFQRYGLHYVLYIGELTGAVLMFIGFIWATTPARVPSVSRSQTSNT
ncbi:MAG TPA: hypothetical protein EYP04_00770 [Anaerolineae bacterium]|nr:hypothetical protein [Anaerolineae bacterium]HIQ04826.1 hypothetical protein [Anaerolineae bacterium]